MIRDFAVVGDVEENQVRVLAGLQAADSGRPQRMAWAPLMVAAARASAGVMRICEQASERIICML